MITAHVFVFHDGKILLLQRAEGNSAAGKWDIPGGRNENGESLEETAVRESLEESGIRIRDIRPLHSSSEEFHGEKVERHVYQATSDSASVTVDPKEHTTYVWATPTEALDIDLISYFKEIILQGHLMESA